MKVSIHASTKHGYTAPLREALIISGQAANICYMKDDFDTIFHEDQKKSSDRAISCADSGHHSIFSHANYTFCFEGISKAAAIVLNNKRPYTTSEKSGRFTEMTTDGDESILYHKWIERCKKAIARIYPRMSDAQLTKYAQENARCFISMFTPIVTMDHTIDVREANYFIRWCRDFASQGFQDGFRQMLRGELMQIADEMAKYVYVVGLEDARNRSLPLFGSRIRQEEFGENFCANFQGSFATFAHLHRHRSLDFEIMVPNSADYGFFVPAFLDDDECEEWLADMRSVEHLYPAGMKILINARGRYEDLGNLLHERLCGAALKETCDLSKALLDRYCNEVREKNPDVYDFLHYYQGKTKCQFTQSSCLRPCVFGPQNVFTRKV